MDAYQDQCEADERSAALRRAGQVRRVRPKRMGHTTPNSIEDQGDPICRRLNAVLFRQKVVMAMSVVFIACEFVAIANVQSVAMRLVIATAGVAWILGASAWAYADTNR